MTQPEFDTMYKLHQPPAVRALFDMPMLSPERLEAAKALADRGYTIDVPIMAWGWDPYYVMVDRLGSGLTWAPSGNGQNLGNGPGGGNPALPPYDPKNPPSGSIKVSLDPADYPPFDAPIVRPPKPADYPVGDQMNPALNMYFCLDPTLTEVGKEFTNSRGTFRFTEYQMPFGEEKFFVKQ